MCYARARYDTGNLQLGPIHTTVRSYVFLVHKVPAFFCRDNDIAASFGVE